MENNISKYHFTVEPFSEDYRGNLSWGTLGNLLLRCASLSAGTFGFGYEQVVQRRLAWVLSRLIIDVPAMPRTGEQFEIQTWVKSVYRQFTDRHYAIMRPDGTAYGYAVSTWALINIDTRQPVDLSQMPDDQLWQCIVPEREAPIAPPTRLRLQTPELLAEHTAAYTDLDINGHASHLRYIDWCCNIFGAGIMSRYAIQRFRIAYMHEVRIDSHADIELRTRGTDFSFSGYYGDTPAFVIDGTLAARK